MMTKDEFKQRWESGVNGDGITYDDVANCAIEWGLTSRPRAELLLQVLTAAGVER